MARRLNLTEIGKNTIYQITGFEQQGTDYAEKLHKMGFIEGTPLQLAPVDISDPIVIQIRGCRIALRKSEAKQIFVEEVNNA